MGRSYGNKTIERLRDSGLNSTSLQFAAVCVDARFDTNLLAQYFGVSRMTIHNWFHDKTMRPHNEEQVTRFTQKVLNDLDCGILPIKNKTKMRNYLNLGV
jgi:hypothetical protein